MSITYNGKNLEASYGLVALGRGTYGAPERDIERVHVPGRNGDLLFDNGGYLDIDVTYPCSMSSSLPEQIRALRQHLYKSPGYHVLTDSYNPDEYRLAEFRGPFEPDVFTARGNDAGNFDLTFHCKPQRFLTKDPQYVPIVQRSSDGTTITVVLTPLDTAPDSSRMDTIRILPLAGNPVLTGVTGYENTIDEDGTNITEDVTQDELWHVLTERRADYEKYKFTFSVGAHDRVRMRIDVNGVVLDIDTKTMVVGTQMVDMPYTGLNLTGFCGPMYMIFTFVSDIVEDELTLNLMNGDGDIYTMTFDVPETRTRATIDFDTYEIFGITMTGGQWPKIDGYDDVSISISSSTGRLMMAQADTREWRI